MEAIRLAAAPLRIKPCKQVSEIRVQTAIRTCTATHCSTAPTKSASQARQRSRVTLLEPGIELERFCGTDNKFPKSRMCWIDQVIELGMDDCTGHF